MLRTIWIVGANGETVAVGRDPLKGSTVCSTGGTPATQLSHRVGARRKGTLDLRFHRHKQTEERPRVAVRGETPRRRKTQGNAHLARECFPMLNPKGRSPLLHKFIYDSIRSKIFWTICIPLKACQPNNPNSTILSETWVLRARLLPFCI